MSAIFSSRPGGRDLTCGPQRLQVQGPVKVEVAASPLAGRILHLMCTRDQARAEVAATQAQLAEAQAQVGATRAQLTAARVVAEEGRLRQA